MRRGVLAVRQDSLGDVLVTGPAIRALAAGGEPVSLLCGPRGAAAARLLPGVGRVLVHLAPWIDPEPPAVRADDCAALIAEVAELAPREAVIFTSFHQSPLPTALLLRLAGVPRIAAISDDYPGSLLDLRHRVDEEIHEVDRALSLAEAAGHGLPPGDPGRLRVVGSRAGSPRPGPSYVVVHPGTSVPARAWAPERWAELVGLLVEEGRRVVVTGDGEETELTARVAAGARAAADPGDGAPGGADAADLRDGSPDGAGATDLRDGSPGNAGALDLGGRLSLAGLAALLRDADAVAVGNTGPAHLAAAVGTPVASLFAPTVPPRRWRPWGVRHELLFQGVPCAGCRVRECPVPGHPCLGEVEPHAVAAALGRLTAGRREELVG